jgi:argininosuccinate lyase
MVLDPWQIVVSRTTLGGAAPSEVSRMADQVAAQASELAGEARQWRDRYQAAEDALVAAARRASAPESAAPDLAGPDLAVPDPTPPR